MKKWFSLILITLTTGCAAFYQPAPSGKMEGVYHKQIRDWQIRIKKEGWSGKLMDDVVSGSIRMIKYKKEAVDHWDTPKEFIKKGLQGDCEDIAVFIMYTLKRLRYDRGVRIQAVKTLSGDHAILRVEMPDSGQWKNYETVPVPLGQFDRLFYIPIVEFDENTIVYYEKGKLPEKSGLGNSSS